MHNTASTSVESYRTLDGGVDDKVLAYLRSIAPQSSNIADTASAMGWERSTVSGCFNRLKNAELIEYDGKRPSRRTGKTAMHFKVPLQESMFGL